MFRMLIVDDEPEIVENLYELIAAEDLPQIDIIKTASSREALATVNSLKIDILLTDIRMPGVTGLQLAEAARANWPNCRIIFLTGYNEFEYAYSAIKNNCEDYLLKTESDKGILETVSKVIAKLEGSLIDEELLARAKAGMRQALPVLQREFIQSFIDGSVRPEETGQDKLDELEIHLDCRQDSYVLLGTIDGLTRWGAGGASSRAECMMALKMIVDGALSRFPQKQVAEIGGTGVVCLVQSGADTAEAVYANPAEGLSLIRGAVETIQSISAETLGMTVSFALCDQAVQWLQIPEKFSRLKKTLDFCSGIGTEAFFTDKSFSEGSLEKIISTDQEMQGADLRALGNAPLLTTYLERGMKEEYFALLNQLIEQLKPVKNKNNIHALEIYYTVAGCLLTYINRWNTASGIATLGLGIYKLTRADEHETWANATDYLTELSNDLFSAKQSVQDRVLDASIHHVQQYIQNHLGQELSLDKLAESVYFNPSYLSRLFKKTTGVNLSQYIMDARIAKAKTLLALTDMKIHELAQKVGLESSIYFARAFKKATSMTPQEYRELNYKR